MLLDLLHIELLGLLKITHKVLDQLQVGRKFDSQTKEASNAPESRTNSTSYGNVCGINNCLTILDYFRSGTNKEVDKRVSRLLLMKIHKEFTDIFLDIGRILLKIVKATQLF